MKKLMTVLASLAVSVGALADTLYWQVTKDAATTATGGNGQTWTYNADYAILKIGSSDRASGTVLDESALSYAEGSEYAMPVAPVTITLTPEMSASEQSFWIELFDTGGTYDPVTGFKTDGVGNQVAYTIPVSYADMETFLNSSMATLAPVWHGGATAVPEPTSALLMLMGMGLLALRRRKNI